MFNDSSHISEIPKDIFKFKATLLRFKSVILLSAAVLNEAFCDSGVCVKSYNKHHVTPLESAYVAG